jgi:hypothetical protein
MTILTTLFTWLATQPADMQILASLAAAGGAYLGGFLARHFGIHGLPFLAAAASGLQQGMAAKPATDDLHARLAAVEQALLRLALGAAPTPPSTPPPA